MAGKFPIDSPASVFLFVCFKVIESPYSSKKYPIAQETGCGNGCRCIFLICGGGEISQKLGFGVKVDRSTRALSWLLPSHQGVPSSRVLCPRYNWVPGDGVSLYPVSGDFCWEEMTLPQNSLLHCSLLSSRCGVIVLLPCASFPPATSKSIFRTCWTVAFEICSNCAEEGSSHIQHECGGPPYWIIMGIIFFILCFRRYCAEDWNRIVSNFEASFFLDLVIDQISHEVRATPLKK